MKNTLYIKSVVNHRLKYINSYNVVDSFVCSSFNYKNFKINAIVKSTNSLSELNIIKAQKKLLLEIFFEQQARGLKKVNLEHFEFLLTQPNNKLSELLYILRSLKQNNIEKNEENKYIIIYKDLLLELANLNFYKLNLNSFSDVNILFNFPTNNSKVINKWIQHETFDKKRF